MKRGEKEWGKRYWPMKWRANGGRRGGVSSSFDARDRNAEAFNLSGTRKILPEVTARAYASGKIKLSS